MRRLTTTVLAAALAALLVSTAFAQPGGLFGGGGFTSPAQLIANKGVQEELKLTDEQKAKATKIGEELRGKAQEVFQNAAGDFDKVRTEMQKLNDAAAKTVNAMLKPEQAKRLKEIELQVASINALTREDIQKELKLTDKQKNEISQTLKEIQKDIQDLGPPDFQDQEAMKKRNDKIQTLRKDNLAKVVKTFSAEQQKAWTEMLGKSFNYVPTPFGGRRGGGGN
jgi:Spy/CpxP family protein refolding chaperone